jgi:hypothetical protein
MSSIVFQKHRYGCLFSGVSDFDGLFASIVTALRAYAVGEDGGTAVAAGGQLGSGDEIVSSSLISSDSRVSSFRMWHIYLIFIVINPVLYF